MIQQLSKTSRSESQISQGHEFFLCVFFLKIYSYQLCRWGAIEFPLPFGRVLSPTESFIHELDEKVPISGLFFLFVFSFF